MSDGERSEPAVAVPSGWQPTLAVDDLALAAADEPDGPGELERPRSGPTVEHAAWLFVLLISGALRLLSLGAVPLNANEGARALQTWLVVQTRPPGTWPGGLADALTALVFKLFGAGDVSARVVPALAGVALVASFWLLRRHVDRGPALLAALLAAISPVMVASARSSDGQALGMTAAVILMALALDYLDAPRSGTLVAIMALAAWGLGTDAMFVAGAALLALWLALRGVWLGDAEVRRAWSAARADGGLLLRATPIATAGLLLAVSRYGLDISRTDRLRPAALAGWSAAFQPTRPGVPWHYVLDVAVGYEAPLAIAGACGVALALRHDRWRRRPILGLLLCWLAGGLLLDLAMASHTPSTLLIAFVPLCLLGGLAVDAGVRQVASGPVEGVDLLLAAGLTLAIVYSALRWAAVDVPVILAGGPSATSVIVGPLLIVAALALLYLRLGYAGPSALLPAGAVVGLFALVWSLHGAGALAFANGDEFLTGARTTRVGVTYARLLEQTSGGVGTVDSAALRPLAWYLRDTLASGGHGGSQLVAASAQTPAGFSDASQNALIARAWAPSSVSGAGMVRWWLYREAWGGTRDVDARLVVRGR